jgi:hypothetical protein
LPSLYLKNLLPSILLFFLHLFKFRMRNLRLAFSHLDGDHIEASECVIFFNGTVLKTMFGAPRKKWAEMLLFASLHGMLPSEASNGAGRDGKEYFGNAPSLEGREEGDCQGTGGALTRD